MIPADLDSAVTAARAIGHPARLRVLVMLRSGELCVCQVTEVLALAPSTVSAHLRELRRSGLVAQRREGRWVHVRLSEDPTARAWVAMAIAAAGADPRLAADARRVEELRRVPVEELCRRDESAPRGGGEVEEGSEGRVSREDG